MKYIKKGSLSYIVLDLLEKSVDGFIKIQDFRQHSGAYLYGDGRDLPKSALSQALNRLKQGGIIEEVTVNSEVIFKLTSSGQDMLGADDRNWDGKWRIVSFDIPEEKRIVRNLFRRNLKKWGFKYLHKSVWVSKKDVYDKLVNYIHDLRIEKWVTVIEADRISTSLS